MVKVMVMECLAEARSGNNKVTFKCRMCLFYKFWKQVTSLHEHFYYYTLVNIWCGKWVARQTNCFGGWIPLLQATNCQFLSLKGKYQLLYCFSVWLPRTFLLATANQTVFTDWLKGKTSELFTNIFTQTPSAEVSRTELLNFSWFTPYVYFSAASTI